jgi:hypothetical protein
MYILVVIDCFSKYVWMAPLKTKNSIDVSTAMENILLKVKPPPKTYRLTTVKSFLIQNFKV